MITLYSKLAKCVNEWSDEELERVVKDKLSAQAYDEICELIISSQQHIGRTFQSVFNAVTDEFDQYAQQFGTASPDLERIICVLQSYAEPCDRLATFLRGSRKCC